MSWFIFVYMLFVKKNIIYNSIIKMILLVKLWGIIYYEFVM